MEQRSGYSLRASGHTYITLNYNGEFLYCYDNDIEYADSIRDKIEKRTRMKIEEIQLENKIEDFSGFRFLTLGHRNFITKEK